MRKGTRRMRNAECGTLSSFSIPHSPFCIQLWMALRSTPFRLPNERVEGLRHGTPAKAAWTIALGFFIGAFPILGITTVICALVATVFRLKQGSIQVGNYLALPVQIFGLIPFLRLGERLTHSAPFVFVPRELLAQMPHVSDATMRAFVYAQWHAILG